MTINIVDDESSTLDLFAEAVRDEFFAKKIKCMQFDDCKSVNIRYDCDGSPEITICLFGNPNVFISTEAESLGTKKAFYIIDYNMAPLNGLETIEQTIAHAKELKIPLSNFVLYTGNAKHLPTAVEAKLKELGVDVISKGNGQEALFDKINTVIEGVA